MEKIIKVVVDLALGELDKEFDYIVPSNLESKIKIGQVVRVPFGNRKIKAFVTKTDAKTDIQSSKLKKIESLVYEESFFDQKLLALFKWVANYYHSYLAQVIKAALPVGITDQKIKKKEVKYLKLNHNLNIKDELENLDKRATKQSLILEFLLENINQELELKKVLAYAETSRDTVKRLIDKNLVILYSKTIVRRPEFKSNFKLKDSLDFCLNQSEVKLLSKILAKKEKSGRFLLKTNNNSKRYFFIIEIIKKLLAKNQNLIVLIPELRKDYLFLEQLNSIFNKKIAFLHSKLSKGEFFDEWQRIKNGQAKLVVGARSAIFAPFKKVDAVIILEENNENYKQQEHPLFHAKQVAARRLQAENSLLILESPLPSVESSYLAKKSNYQKLELAAEKYSAAKEIIDMKKEVEKGNLGDLSSYLKEKIKIELKKNNNLILFLNRKGTANYVICRKCGEVLKCDNCDISLNYHQKSQKLRCHYCAFEKVFPKLCPNCGSSFISPAGIGIEKLFNEIKSTYPDVNSAKIDSDLKEKEITDILEKFREGKIDILIATSILIKNQFYKNLNFLAVISADTGLNSSDFRAAENNYFLLKQLNNLLQNSAESKIYLQSYNPEHYALKTFVDNGNFQQKELLLRQKRNYPPFSRLLNIIISSKDEKKAEICAKKLNKFLTKKSNKIMEKTNAAPAVLSKIRNKYRWQIILKFKSIRKREYIIQLIEKIFLPELDQQSVEIRIDVDPYQML